MCKISKSVFYILSFIMLASSSIANPTSEFLGWSPGARATGLGEAISTINDPHSSHFNPGAVGVFVLDHQFAASYSYFEYPEVALTQGESWEMYYEQAILGFKGTGTFAGKPIEYSTGLQTHYKRFNRGEMEWRGENNEYLGTFDNWTRDFNVGIGFGFRSFFELGVGVAMSNLHYQPGSLEPSDNPEDGVNYRGWHMGTVLRLPLVHGVKYLFDINLNHLSSPFQYEIIPAVGWSRMNDGILLRENEDLLGLSVFGTSLTGQLNYGNVQILELLYTKDYFTETNPRDDNYEGKTVGNGFEYTILDIVSIRSGNSKDDRYRNRFEVDMNGYSIHSKGIGRLLDRQFGKSNIKQNRWLDFLLTRVDIEYALSYWTVDDISAADHFSWWEVGVTIQ